MAGKAVATRGSAGLETVSVDNYPALIDGVDGLLDVLQDNVGTGLNANDLTRVSAPTGGRLSFEIPDPLNPGRPEMVHALEDVVLIHWQHARSYWPVDPANPDSISHTPPTCSSADGKFPIATGEFGDFGDSRNMNIPLLINGEQRRTCEGCPMNAFGSHHKGSGKACKQQLLLFVLREGDLLPTLLAVPPTSLKLVRTFMISLSAKLQMHYSGVRMTFALKEASSNGNDYSQIVPSITGLLEGARKTRLGGPEDGSPAALSYKYAQEFAKVLTVETIVAAAAGPSEDGEVMPQGLSEDGLGGDFADHGSEPEGT
ncbi:MAG TPA: hypothetical protein VE155_06480 [Pseudonocardiaceae bacterium]|nr:hypothetical protein [Pseudonocardiaceae bacterium]